MLWNDSHTLLGGVILWYNETTPGMFYRRKTTPTHQRYGLINSECMLSFSYFLEKGESFENVKYFQMVHHM